MCLSNIPKHFTNHNIKKAVIKWIYVYDLSVYYNANIKSDILNIHKYLLVSIFWFLTKQVFIAL